VSKQSCGNRAERAVTHPVPGSPNWTVLERVALVGEAAQEASFLEVRPAGPARPTDAAGVPARVQAALLRDAAERGGDVDHERDADQWYVRRWGDARDEQPQPCRTATAPLLRGTGAATPNSAQWREDEPHGLYDGQGLSFASCASHLHRLDDAGALCHGRIPPTRDR
jgi:hypothetical protein